MPSFQPALLIELINHEPSGKETNGQAIMWISRNERGGMEASGTFKTAGPPLTGGEQLQDRAFQYEGPAYEAGKASEIRAVVFVVSVQGDLSVYGFRSTFTLAFAARSSDRCSLLGSGMPYFVFQKPRGTTNWKLSNRFEDHKQACAARDHAASENVVARMIKADTEGEARGKSGVTWNAITNDPGR